MTAFKFRARMAGAHIQLDIFAGPDLDHLVLCGTLRFEPHEYQQFVFRILMEIEAIEGAWAPAASFEEEWMVMP